MSNHDDVLKLEDMEGLGLEEFDPAQYLTSPETIAAYMTEILAEGNVALFQSAMEDVMRAQGVANVAEKAGITREGAYKAFRRGSKPRFETVAAMLDALGLSIAIVPKPHDNSYAPAA
jgi:probable addiction module antidote protein